MEQAAEQVEQFITMLRNAGHQLEEDLHHVEGDAAALDHLAEELHEQLSGLAHEVQGLLDELEHDEQALVSELDHLGEAAQAAADTRLAAAQDQLEHAESDLGQSMVAVRNELDHDAAGLHDGGFQPLAGTLHTVDAAVDASRSQADAGFAAFEAAVQSLSHELQAAGTEVDHSLVAAAAILGDEDRHGLEGDGSECVAGLHELGPEVEAGCGNLAEQGGHAYQAWGSEADHEAHELEEALTHLFDGSAQAVAVTGSEKIADPADRLESEAIPALLEELEEQQSTLAAALETAAELAPLAADLEVTSGVISHVNDLVNSMNE